MRDWMEGERRASSIRGGEAREGEGRRAENLLMVCDCI